MKASAKRALSMLLCILLLAALFSFPAYAAEEGQTQGTDTEEASDLLTPDPLPGDGKKDDDAGDKDPLPPQGEEGEKKDEPAPDDPGNGGKKDQEQDPPSGDASDKEKTEEPLTVSGGDFAYQDHVYTIHGGEAIVSGSSAEDRIVVDGDAKLKLSGVRIEANGAAAVTLAAKKIKVAIELAGGNELAGGAGYAALEVGWQDEDVHAVLTLTGDGSLRAIGGRGGAGIGGSLSHAAGLCGTINVEGGSIRAVGGVGAAGIGTGAFPEPAEGDEAQQARAQVNISGGSVVAYADGAKFALDTKSGGGMDTVSAPAGSIRNVFQGTFAEESGCAGSTVRVVSAGESAGESHKLKLPAGYRSFAVSVDGCAEGYCVCSEDLAITYAAGKDEKAGPDAAPESAVYAAGVLFGDVFYLAKAPEGVRRQAADVRPMAADPELTDLKVVIVWDDDEDSAGQRPASVQVTLLINGVESDNKLTLAAPGWAGTFSDLPVSDSEGAIQYGVSQDKISQYTQSNYEMGDGTVTITNSFAPEEPVVLHYVTDDPPVKKTLVGRTPPKAEKFRFTLEAVSTSVTELKGKLPMPAGSDGQKKTVTITGPGETTFGLITFMQPGTYTYQVKEVKGSATGYTYDTNVFTLTYTITQSGDSLEGVRRITKNNKTAATPIFVNGYSTSVRTGDDRNAALWGAVTGLALCGVAIPAFLLLRRRRRDKR